jgi:acetylornithine/N-succinyldiaminopimelate aminotransferase
MSVFNVYPLFDVEPIKAKGSFLWDKSGQKYLDMYGGHAVVSIGHRHPHFIQSLKNQMDKITFYSNSVQNQLQERLSEKIDLLSGNNQYNLFMCNSGAEANENALKIASFYNGRKKIIAFRKSFHGRTSGAVSITDDTTIIAPSNENSNVVFLPLNDVEALNAAFYDHQICAVIVEGIQGVGGINLPSEKFLKRARALCDYTGALLILDEVQSGYGRTGKFFAHQYHKVMPDLISMAKGMGNGFPVAGLLIHENIPAKFGMLGSTFGGNHLACAAALSVLEVIEQEGLMQNALEVGNFIADSLKSIEGIKEIRGIGLMIGIQLEMPAAEIRKILLEEHYIFTGNASQKNTIRILPALNITKQEASIFVDAFKNVIEHALVKEEMFL